MREEAPAASTSPAVVEVDDMRGSIPHAARP